MEEAREGGMGRIGRGDISSLKISSLEMLSDLLLLIGMRNTKDNHTLIQRTLIMTTTFVPQDFAIKKNLLLYRIPTCTNTINDKKPFSSYLLQETWIFVRISSVRQF